MIAKSSFYRGSFSLPFALVAFLSVGCGSFYPGQQSVPNGASATTSTLAVKTTSNTVAPSGTATISISGGVAPYTYKIVSGQGTLQPDPSNLSAIYTAPSSTGTVKISVSDSAQNVTAFILTISNTTVATSSTPAQLSCAGTYIINSDTSTSVLVIVEDSSGHITGTLDTSNISGVCTADNMISFTSQTDSAQYEGYYFSNASATNHVSMGGIFTDAGVLSNWSSTK